MRHIHEISLGPWPSGLVITDNRAAYGRFMRAKCGKHEFAKFPGNRAGLCTQLNGPDGTSLLVIAIGPQDDEVELAATIAHEATHAMRWILEHAAEHSPGTESQAYLVEHIVKNGLRLLSK